MTRVEVDVRDPAARNESSASMTDRNRLEEIYHGYSEFILACAARRLGNVDATALGVLLDELVRP